MQSNLIRTSQPKVPFSLEGTNSMRRGLSFFLDTSSKIPRDLVTGVALSQGSVPPNNGATLRGYLGTTFSATGDNTFITLPNTTLRSASSAYSILIGFSTTANHTGNPRALVSKSDGAPSNNGFNFVHTNNTSVAVQCKNTTDLGTISAANPTNINDGQPQWAAISLNKTSGQPWSVRLNKTTSTPANLTGTWNFSSPTARLGNSIDPYWPDFDGHIFYVAIWERYVVPQEWDQIFANPWQLFQPEKRSRLWAAPIPSVKMTPLPAKGPSIIRSQTNISIYSGQNKFTNGLSLVHSGDLSYVDKIGSVGNKILSSASIITSNLSKGSRVISSSSNSAYLRLGSAAASLINYDTIKAVHIRFRFSSLPTAIPRLLVIGTGASTFQIGVDAVSSRVGLGYSSGNDNLAGPNFTLSSNTEYVLTALLSGNGTFGTSSLVRAWINGVEYSKIAVQAFGGVNSGIYIGNRADLDRGWWGEIGEIFIWNNSSPGVEDLLSLINNPRQVFSNYGGPTWLPTYSDRVIPQLSNPTVANPTSTGGTPRYTVTY